MVRRVLLWGFISLIALVLAVGLLAGNDSLEKAVRGDEFKPLPNGNWIALQNISLVYSWRTIANLGLGKVQFNVCKGATHTGNGGSEDARLLEAHNPVCGAKQ